MCGHLLFILDHNTFVIFRVASGGGCSGAQGGCVIPASRAILPVTVWSHLVVKYLARSLTRFAVPLNSVLARVIQEISVEFDRALSATGGVLFASQTC